MAGKITEYSNVVDTPMNDQDKMDWSQDIGLGVFESRSMRWDTLQSEINNLFNNNGTFAAARTIDMNNTSATWNDGDFIFNELGGDFDFRIEGDTETNLFFTDASTDRVGIGTNSPAQLLDVRGSAIFDSGLLTVNSGSGKVGVNNSNPTTFFFQVTNTSAAANEGILIDQTVTDSIIGLNLKQGATFAGSLRYNGSTQSIVSTFYRNRYGIFTGNISGQKGMVIAGQTGSADDSIQFILDNTAYSAPTTIATFETDGTWNTKKGRKLSVTEVDATTYDLLVSDHIVNVIHTPTAAVTSLTLPTAQTLVGRVITISDGGGNAGTNNITIDTEGSENINGSATEVISTNYGFRRLFSDGSNWFIIGL